MTKADLVEEVTQLGDLTRRDGEMIVDTIFDSVIHALRSGDKIEIRGFGSFRIRQRKPRTGRNPKTGAKVDVPAKRVPYFKPSKELRDLVNPKDPPGTPEPGEGHSGGLGLAATPITLIIRPVNPRSVRWEKNRSVRQPVHCPVRKIAPFLSPAASNCRLFASARSRCMLGPISLWPGARAVRNSMGYFCRIGIGVVHFAEEFRGIVELGLELLLHLFPDGIAALPDSRSDGGNKILWPGAELQPHAAYSVFHDARQRAAPPGMKGRDCSLLPVRYQNGYAICRLNAQ